MVRTKDKPTHLTSVHTKKVSWNLGDLRTDYSVNSTPGSSTSEVEESSLNHLINDEEEESNDSFEDDDDDDSDYEYKPSIRKKPIIKEVECYAPNEVSVVRPRKKAVKIDYGLFDSVLQKCDFCIKIYFDVPNSSQIHCLLHKISFEVKEFSFDSLKKGDSFWLYVSKEENESAIYFEWCEENEDTTLSNKKLKKNIANNFKYFHVKGILDFDLWNGLNCHRYFEVIFERFEDNVMSFKIYFLKSGLVNINYACEFHSGNRQLAAVVSHLYGIPSFETEGEEKTFKPDVDSFYKAIKEVHNGIEYSDCDVQHPNLIPVLRPYQKQAVKWMLHQERNSEVTSLEGRLHPLYTEIKSLDDNLLYYNRYGRFLASSKHLEVSPCPGGILADEMGLGKTVEVLACLMCHKRKDIPDPLHNSKQESKDTNSCLDLSVSSGLEESETSITFENDLKEETSSKPYENDLKEEISEEIIVTSRRRKASIKINYSLLDSILSSDEEVSLSSDKEDSSYIPKTCPNDSSDDSNTENEKTPVEMVNARSLSRPKRKASQINFADLDDNDLLTQNPKKQKLSTPKKNFDAEKKISEDIGFTIIENVILEMCWNGVLNDYKKKGSHKAFRKYLQKKNKDPYYMMTMREKLNTQYLSKLAEYSATPLVNQNNRIKGYFDTKVEQKSYFECVCGKKYSDYDNVTKIQCSSCSLWQHPECVQYDPETPFNSEYFCPHCWTNQPPVKSGATLIVAPSTICHQWVEEIQKHIKQESLKVFVYNGVACHGYIQPLNLSQYDIVITTYETLRREVNYVDLPHSNSEAGRRFRFPKRFMATPSPLPCVQWWRVCLDEAQMVECVTTKTAEMALRLSAINRWCITGTPIQKTVNDLQGLLMFLGVDPYCVPQWWNRVLYDRYCCGDTKPLHDVMAKYMWRNSKVDVAHQLDIPHQMEEIHWLTFMPVEEHFYKRLHAECSSEAVRKINKFPDKSTKLSSLDRQTLGNLLQPLLKLRQACVHPQVVRGHFMNLNRKTLTMEQLLENLLKKTQVEVEDAHRIIIASLNGLAALDIIRENYSSAVEKYREALRSIEENKDNFKTDSLQQLHTLHNLAEVIEANYDRIQPTLRDEKLREEAKAIEDRYLKLYPQRVYEAEEECNQNCVAVQELRDRMHLRCEWWISALETFDREFVQEVREELLSSYTRFEEPKCILYNIQNKVQLMQLIRVKLKLLECQREAMITDVRKIRQLDPEQMLNGAIDCHLRPSEFETQLCSLCLKHKLFEEYEQNLFFMKDIKLNRSTDRSKETSDMKNKLQLLEATRQGNWGQSEIERILRYVQTKSLSRVDQEIHEESQIHLQKLQAMKKEFKNFRILWRTIYDHVSALDEVNMAKLRFRLRFPGEEIPPEKTKKSASNPSDDLEKKIDAPTHVLDESEVDQQEMKLKSDKIVSRNDFRVKLGQFFYLKNLRKRDFGKDGGSNPELCPICQGKLGEKWKVLLCGHCFCMDCACILIKRVPKALGGSIKCPMCRQSTKISEIAYVDIRGNEETENIKVTGSLSTKIEGVVRVLLKIKASDPEAKVLIFSSWGDVLEVIADGLAQNGITHRVLLSNQKFQTNLSAFKSKQEITALLMPLSSGANGLNLVEAKHVMLVEPILNSAAEVQAIGRIHRIGQTRATFVHRFLIRSTIEERMHNILHPKLLQNSNEEISISIGDLNQLFAQDETEEEVMSSPSSVS